MEQPPGEPTPDPDSDRGADPTPDPDSDRDADPTPDPDGRLRDSPPSSRTIAQLAARQHGHVARRQLLALGLGADAIGYRVATGELITVHAGVYALGYRRVEPVARAMAAVLACGPGAVLSHDSALALWGLRRWPRDPEVIAPGCVRRPGIVAHRSTTLTRGELAIELGVRTTRAARALRDLRGRLTVRQLTRLANDARLRRILSAEEARALLRQPGPDRSPTRSGLEDDFQRFLNRHGLPRPLVNARVAGHEVDALWPAERLIVELDHYATHGDPAAFQRDRDRDLSHLALGLHTLRLTAERLTDATAELLREILRPP